MINKNDNPHQSSMTVILNTKGEVLLLKRPDGSDPKEYPNLWCLVGGHGIIGETPREGALREIFEETGIKIKPDNLKFVLEKVDGEKNYYFFKTETNQEPNMTRVLDEHVGFSWVRPDKLDDYQMIQDTGSIIKRILRNL